MTNLETAQAVYLAAANAVTAMNAEKRALHANKTKTVADVNEAYNRFDKITDAFNIAKDALDAAEKAAK